MDEDTSDALISIADRIAEPYKFRSAWVVKTLSSLEDTLLSSQIESLRSQINSCRSQIQTYMSYINQYLTDKKRVEGQLEGLYLKQNSGSESAPINELIGFVERADNIHISNIADATLNFYVTGYLDDFDPDLYARLRASDESYLNDYDDDVLILLDALYYDHTFKLRTYAKFYIDLKGGGYAESCFHDPRLSQTYMPNPHLYHHACLGGHEPMLASAMDNYDYVYAMQVCGSATSNISFSDSTVGQELCEDFENMFDSSCRCFELPDGTLYTAQEALEYLKG